MTPAVFKCVQTYGLDPLASGPWIDVAPAEESIPTPAACDFRLPFPQFTVAGVGRNGSPVAITVREDFDIYLSYYEQQGRRNVSYDFALRLQNGGGWSLDFDFIYSPDTLAYNLLRRDKRALEDLVSLVGFYLFHAVKPPAAAAVPTRAVQLSKRPPNYRGKSTGYEWKVIEITPPAPPSPPLGGTHASPRAHERRGHYFRRGDKTYWRKSYRVGDPKDGFIFHTYVTPSVTPPQSS